MGNRFIKVVGRRIAVRRRFRPCPYPRQNCFTFAASAPRNMARFYALSIQPTLFGGASLVRNWGRIGTNGQAMMETFDEDAGAGEAFSRLERRKRKRGYDGLIASSSKT